MQDLLAEEESKGLEYQPESPDSIFEGQLNFLKKNERSNLAKQRDFDLLDPFNPVAIFLSPFDVKLNPVDSSWWHDSD